MERLARLGVVGRHAHRAFEPAQRVRPASELDVDPSQVHVRELPRFVAGGALGLLEPRDRLVELALLHQVDADVVVGVAEVGIDLNGLEALRGRFLQPSLEAVGPAQEGVRLGGGAHRDRAPVELDGGLQIAVHLAAVLLAPQLDGPLAVFRVAHGGAVLTIWGPPTGSLKATGHPTPFPSPPRAPAPPASAAPSSAAPSSW